MNDEGNVACWRWLAASADIVYLLIFKARTASPRQRGFLTRRHEDKKTRRK
jgi:hypothetical protein